MKIGYSLLLLGALVVMGLASCKDNTGKSLSELKSEQSDAIKQFQSKNNMKVVELSGNTLPQNIDKSVYYHFKNGLYMRVLDEGNMQDKAVLGETNVFARLAGYRFSLAIAQGLSFDNLSKATYPEIQFRYIYYYSAGENHYNLVTNSRPVDNYDILMCEGIAFPVSLLGNGARVSLIIPFELGSSSTYSQGLSTYVSEVQYTYK